MTAVSTAATRAAIKRASQQARNAMRALDAQTIAALLRIYTEAADDVRAAIQARVDGNDTVPLQQLRALQSQIDDVVDSLGAQRDALLLQGLEDAAALGVRPYTMPGVGATGVAGEAVLDSGAAMRISEGAVRFVQSFTAADGLTLSDRLWRLDQGAKETLSRAIGQAVVSGMDAARAAAQFMYSGQPVPADITARLKAAKVGNLVRAADLLTGTGGEVWKAERVFRTEINRAHGTAYMDGAEQTPGFAGFKFLLSPLHPAPDICDLYAAQNKHGLGPGVYPTAKDCPWPAHPNTLSFVNMVFAEEVTDADRAGKETELQALGRLAPDIRAGVLGKTKAEYFDQGLLTKGAIRSPLRAVDERLARQTQAKGADQSTQITRFATEAMGIADRRTVEVLGKVDNAAQILAKTGLDVTGYSRILDNYGVRHTMKQHGDPGKEAKRGQIAVTLSDFSKIPLITSQPDNIFADGKNKIGRDVIVFVKVIDGVGYRHVEELRGKNKLVATDSLRKKKGAWGA